MSKVEVSLQKLCSEKGINLLHCCPKCKNARLLYRPSLEYYACQMPGCGWKGKDRALKLNKHYDFLVDKIIEQAAEQKDFLILALDQGCILPVDLLEVL
jgi:ribosomal protein L37AE/L43A